MGTKPCSELIPTNRHNEDSEQTSQVCWVLQKPLVGLKGLEQKAGLPAPPVAADLSCASLITHGAAKPLISGDRGLGKAGIGPASAGLGPQAVPLPHLRHCQLFLEEAASLLGPSPDGPLLLMGARCGAGLFIFLGWGEGGDLQVFQTQGAFLTPTQTLLLTAILVPGSLRETKPLYTPECHKPPHFCSKGSLPSNFNRDLAHPWRQPSASFKAADLSLRAQGGASPWFPWYPPRQCPLPDKSTSPQDSSLQGAPLHLSGAPSVLMC